jgi:flagellar hook assembly protein FlgD
MRAFLGYKVYRNEIEIAQISETNYTDSNLTNGTYNYKVTALYDSGESAYTNQVEVMIEVLYAPTNLVYEVQNENDVVLNWNAPAMRTFLGYKIYRNEIEIAQINETYYTDSNLTNGTYNYKVTALYDSGESEPTNLVSVLIDVQTSVDEVINIQTTKMNNLYPNPFNPATNLSYQLAKDDFVTIVIYDIKGKKIKTLVEGYQTSGEYQIHWEGTKDDQSKAASGIYFFRMISGNYNSTRKAILLK